jgi:hypothetical protein
MITMKKSRTLIGSLKYRLDVAAQVEFGGKTGKQIIISSFKRCDQALSGQISSSLSLHEHTLGPAE